MAVDNPTSERRDISGILSEISISVAVIREKTTKNEEGLARVETQINRVNSRLDDALFREEYERRHNEVVNLAQKALDESRSAQQKANEVAQEQRDQRARFRWIVGTAIGALGTVTFVIELFLHYHP